MKDPGVVDDGNGRKGLKGKISARKKGRTIILIESIFLPWPDVVGRVLGYRGRLANIVRRLGHFPIKFSSFKRGYCDTDPRVLRHRLDFMDGVQRGSKIS